MSYCNFYVDQLSLNNLVNLFNLYIYLFTVQHIFIFDLSFIRLIQAVFVNLVIE